MRKKSKAFHRTGFPKPLKKALMMTEAFSRNVSKNFQVKLVSENFIFRLCRSQLRSYHFDFLLSFEDMKLL